MHFVLLLFLVFFNVLHGSISCHLFFLIYTWTTYQMVQYSLSNSFVDDVLSFITLINAKTWAYELNSNFKNKSEWTLSFYEFRFEQTGSDSRSYIFKENKIISLPNLFQQYIKNLPEWEIEFPLSYYGQKFPNAYKIRKSVLLD